ncbi:hypothetical protein L1887_19591 [Cichorium endivia]|nr:hypothetical protein L1887_19591 [Cichorium endivia]
MFMFFCQYRFFIQFLGIINLEFAECAISPTWESDSRNTKRTRDYRKGLPLSPRLQAVNRSCTVSTGQQGPPEACNLTGDV